MNAKLLSIYAIIPLSILIITIDQLFMKGYIRHTLPSSPEDLFAFTVLFNLPHIFASSFSFFDREYLIAYREKLLLPSLLIIIGVVCATRFMNSDTFELLFALLTIKHVIGQQLGITAMIAKCKGKAYQIWKWTGLIIGTVLYIGVYLPNMETSAKSFLELASIVLMIPFTISTLYIQSECQNKIGIAYISSNYAMIVFNFFLYLAGYSFFVILTTRIIHDLSAILFYSIHDKNRNLIQSSNVFYKPFIRMGFSSILLCPILAIAAAFPFTYFQKIEWVDTFIVIISIFHYYTDSFTWKRESLHRRFMQS